MDSLRSSVDDPHWATPGGALAVAVFGALVADRAGFLHGLHTSPLIAAVALPATAAASLLLKPAGQPLQVPGPAGSAATAAESIAATNGE